jgi:hypothetical protein
MDDSVNSRYLLEGAVYALEQCGLLLRDANLLYRRRASDCAPSGVQAPRRSALLLRPSCDTTDRPPNPPVPRPAAVTSLAALVAAACSLTGSPKSATAVW